MPPWLGVVNPKLVILPNEADVLTTGNQLRAARGLVAMDQVTLAQASGVSANTIRSMEGRGAGVLSSGLDTIKRVQNALEAAGVEFLNHGQPGVRLAKPAGVRSEHHDAARAKSNEDVRVGAVGAVDRALADVDATKQEKAERRGALTDEPAVVARARSKGKTVR
jgi:hypothetical protein